MSAIIQGVDFVVISAFITDATETQNMIRNRSLAADLRLNYLAYSNLESRFNGVDEMAFTVVTGYDQGEVVRVLDLAEVYQQKSALLLGPMDVKKSERPAVLIDVETRQPIKTGTWVEAEEKHALASDAFTKLNSSAYFIVNWDGE